MSFLIVCMINILLYNGNESEAVITAPDNPVENNPDDEIKEDNIVNDNKGNVSKDEYNNMADRLYPRDIRVLIKADNGSYYHKEITFLSHSGIRITGKDNVYESVGNITVSTDNAVSCYDLNNLKNGDSIILEPINPSKRMVICSINRSMGNPSYEGRFTVTKNEKGYVIVNTLPLETYLYYVIPSEMPAYYSMEALKAQAICARTYALKYIINPGLPEFNADVDDSVSYQVYNNIDKDSNTSKAVDGTNGKVLSYKNELIDAYFYSTSCGIGTKESIWSPEAVSHLPYLTHKKINPKNVENDYSSETAFKNYIMNEDISDYDYGRPYYRWSINRTVSEKEIVERMQKRFEEAGYTVLHVNGEEKVSKKPEDIGTLLDIVVVKRDKGGAIHAIQIVGSKNTYELLTGNTIRYCFALDNTNVVRHDANVAALGSMLPSTFFTIDLIKDGDRVTGWSIVGGGLGHGVGMSQNAAWKMAELGLNHNEILQFFYSGTNLIEVVYEGN